VFISLKSTGVSSVAVAPRGNVPTVIRLPSIPKFVHQNQLPFAVAPRGNVPAVICLPSVSKSVHRNQLPVTPPCNLMTWCVGVNRNHMQSIYQISNPNTCFNHCVMFVKLITIF
jgi:hypothetical protein